MVPHKTDHIKTDTSKLKEHLEDALASLALEGIHPSPEDLKDMELHAAGQINSEELMARAIARAKERNNKQ